MSDVLFKIKIPVPYHAIKKNNKQIAFNRRTGKSFIRSSDKALFLQNWLHQKLTTEKLKQRIDTITDYIKCEMVFYFPESVYYTKKGERSKKLPDLSNLYQLPEDCLQKAGIIENDHLIETHGDSARLPIKDTTYWLEIKITSYR